MQATKVGLLRRVSGWSAREESDVTALPAGRTDSAEVCARLPVPGERRERFLAHSVAAALPAPEFRPWSLRQ